MTKTWIRSIIQISCLISIIAMIWVLPKSNITITKAAQTINEDLPFLRVTKKINATQVEIDDYCLVNITIINLSNDKTAYNVVSEDPIYAEWAFEIKGSASHRWKSLDNGTSVSYAYLLSPKKHGTFKLQQASVRYSTENETAFRSAQSNEVGLIVPPFTPAAPNRDVEYFQTFLYSELAILMLIIAAFVINRRVKSTDTK